jgi:hypothetical protein
MAMRAGFCVYRVRLLSSLADLSSLPLSCVFCLLFADLCGLPLSFGFDFLPYRVRLLSSLADLPLSCVFFLLFADLCSLPLSFGFDFGLFFSSWCCI